MAPPSDLGASDVPLTEDLVSQPKREAFPTFAEWAADGNIEQIFRSHNTASGTIFNIPANHTLFITSAWVTAMSSSVGGEHGIIGIDATNPATGASVRIIGVAVDHLQGQHGGNEACCSTFPMPIRVNSENRIDAFNNPVLGNPLVSMGFIGFLLPKKISIRSV